MIKLIRFSFILIIVLFNISLLANKGKALKNDSLKVDGLLTNIRNSWQNLPKTLILCAQASNIAEKSGNNSLMAQTCFKIGVIHLELLKNHSQSLKYLIKALNFSKDTKDSALMQRCYQTIGNTYTNLFSISGNIADFRDAELNLMRSLEINKLLIKNREYSDIFVANNYINLSELYLNKNDYKLSYKYAQEAEQIYFKWNDLYGIGLTRNNISKSHLIYARKTGAKKDYVACRNKYLYYYNSSIISKYDSIQNLYALSGGYRLTTAEKLFDYYLSMAEISEFLGEKDNFSNYINKSEFYSIESKQIENLINVYKSKSKYYEKFNQKYSIVIKNKLLKLQDSAYTIEIRKKNEFLKAIYEFNQKEIEYTKTDAENKLKSLEIVSQKKQGKIKTILLIIASISITVFCVFLFYFFKLNKKLLLKNKEISTQKDLITSKNRQITDSISFAKFIQDEILFSKYELNAFFKDHFIIYKPKDIVSGDFYFVKEKNNLLLIGVVDCTGHGVSGAMMSLHANSLLERLFEKFIAKNSASYMDQLNEMIKSDFASNKTIIRPGYSNKFGMDISLLVIDLKTKEASYSSTNNPLIIRTIKELIEYRPVKSTLPYSTEKYVSYNFKVSNGDKFYMFTDGFYDQKGGNDSKKYFYKNFKELISSSSILDFSEQSKRLDYEFNVWKGEYQQTDDVTVLGFMLGL